MTFPRTTTEQQPTPEQRLIAALEARARHNLPADAIDDDPDEVPAEQQHRERELSTFERARLAAFAQRGEVPPEYRPRQRLGGRFR